MSEKKEPVVRRRQWRYRELAPQTVVLTVSRNDGAETSATVALLDLSVGGAKVVAPWPVDVTDELMLSFQIPDSDVEMSVCAMGSWSKRQPDDTWQLGMEFFPELSEETLTQLLVIEERDEERVPIDARATARFGDDPATVAVSVHDRSEGGVCLVSRRRASIGETLRLHFDDGADVAVQVRWQAKSGERFLLGCQFLELEQTSGG